MSLQAELDSFKATWTGRVGPDVAKMMADDNAALQPQAATALKVGDNFPALSLPDQLGRPVDIAALAGEGPLLITFYRGGWCPYCNLELRAYQKLVPDITRLAARLIAVTPETPDNALTTAEKNDLAFTVLSDEHGRLADALGIRFELSDAVKAYFVKAGHDLPSRNGNDRWSLPMPATYVVEKGGRIALAFVDPDYRKRLEPSEAVAALAALAERHAA
ncbi:MAG: peroxiredoxin-like family protein [Hyphomicrobiaceae bacterium]|nr:peroxiredoxin-like family protein [Hyphomicrobiaceae bacterium]